LAAPFDPYETLGVSEGTPTSQIKKKYRKLAAKWHPDNNKGNAKALAKFEKITKASKVCVNPGSSTQRFKE
jgi:DnaJ-class molecular chaperone